MDRRRLSAASTTFLQLWTDNASSRESLHRRYLLDYAHGHLFVGARALVLIDAAVGIRIIINIAFDGILAFQPFGVFARREAALGLAYTRITREIARERALPPQLSMLATHPRLQFLRSVV